MLTLFVFLVLQSVSSVTNYKISIEDNYNNNNVTVDNVISNENNHNNDNVTLDNVISNENNHNNDNVTLNNVTLHPESVDESILQDLQLSKCYCGVTEYMGKNGSCQPLDFQISTIELLLDWAKIPPKSVPLTDFKDVIVKIPECDKSVSFFMTTPTKDIWLQKNGKLFKTKTGTHIEKNSYCVENRATPEGVVLEARVCVNKTKVYSCCPPNQFFDPTANKCYQGNQEANFHPPFFMDSKEIRNVPSIPILREIPSCSKDKLNRTVLSPESAIELKVNEDRLILSDVTGNFCVATELNVDSSTSYSVLRWNKCSTGTDGQCDVILDWVIIPLLAASTVFLLLIICFHVITPELRKSNGSKITLCHVASLFLGFCFLLIRADFDLPLKCKVFVPLVQVTFLAAFFWLNVMCYDIWWKLRFKSPATQTSQSSRIQFMWYSLYAWGSPLLIGLVTVIMDNIDSLKDMPGVIVPGFEVKHCWFGDRKATFVYYFLFILVLMVLNLIFFVWVCVLLLMANCTYKKMLKNAQATSNRSWMYLKIFGVMGITWIFEFISWLEGSCEYWIILDIINSMRGVILFAVFFGNKKSINKIKEKLNITRRVCHKHFSRSMTNLRKMQSSASLSIATIESNFTTSKHSISHFHFRRQSESDTDFTRQPHCNGGTKTLGLNHITLKRNSGSSDHLGTPYPSNGISRKRTDSRSDSRSLSEPSFHSGRPSVIIAISRRSLECNTDTNQQTEVNLRSIGLPEYSGDLQRHESSLEHDTKITSEPNNTSRTHSGEFKTYSKYQSEEPKNNYQSQYDEQSSSNEEPLAETSSDNENQPEGLSSSTTIQPNPSNDEYKHQPEEGNTSTCTESDKPDRDPRSELDEIKIDNISYSESLNNSTTIQPTMFNDEYKHEPEEDNRSTCTESDKPDIDPKSELDEINFDNISHSESFSNSTTIQPNLTNDEYKHQPEGNTTTCTESDKPDNDPKSELDGIKIDNVSPSLNPNSNDPQLQTPNSDQVDQEKETNSTNTIKSEYPNDNRIT